MLIEEILDHSQLGGGTGRPPTLGNSRGGGAGAAVDREEGLHLHSGHGPAGLQKSGNIARSMYLPQLF